MLEAKNEDLDQEKQECQKLTLQIRLQQESNKDLLKKLQRLQKQNAKY